MLRRRLVLALPMVAIVVTSCADEDSRSLNRGAISGRIVLSPVAGLNDKSRLRVELGNGEGGVVVDDDGGFAAVDIEPDVYDLRVTYVGGLTPEATRSAYQAFTRRVPLLAGAVVDVGEIRLELATGQVLGRATFTDVEGGASSTSSDATGVATLRLADGELLETDLAIDGSFAFDAVPVGQHELRLDAAGFARGIGAAEPCAVPITVAQADDVVEAGTLQMAEARATLLAGDGDLFSPPTATTWTLTPGISALTVRILSDHAARARAWLDDPSAPPAFIDDPDLDGAMALVVDVPVGVHRLFVQTADRCDTVAPPIEKTLLRDEAPPTVLDVFVPGARVDDSGVVIVRPEAGALPVVVEAIDDEGSIDALAIAVVAADEELHTIDSAALTFVPVVSTGLARLVLTALMPDSEGDFRLVAFARDTSGNVSIPSEAIDASDVLDVLVDTTPPRIVGMVLGQGAAATREPQAILRLDVIDDGSGPARVQTSLTGTFDAAAVPFSPTVLVMLDDGSGDGDKRVSVRVEDGAGNASVAHVDVQLDRTPPRGTLARVDGGTVLAATGPVELLIGHDADVVAVGIGTEEDACGGATPTAPDSASSTRRLVNIPGPDGLVVVRACLRDAAGNQSALTQTFTVDTTPPAATLTLAGGRAFSTAPLVDVIVSSSEQPVQLRFDEAAGSTPPSSSEACAGDAGYAPFRATDRVLLGGEGRRVVWVCLRDAAGLSTLASATITVDTVAPVLRSVTIGDGQAIQRATSSLVRLDGEGAEFMRVGVDRSAELAPLVAFSPDVPVTFAAVDGLHTVQVVLQDEAGNRSAAQSAEVTLVTRGSLAGTVTLEDGGDPTALEAVLVGTTLQASVDATGAFRFVDVAQGQYVVRVRAAAAGVAPVVVDDRVVAVIAGEQVNAGTFVVRAAKGSVVGTVTRELATDHTGIAIELVGTTQTTSTTSAGVFELRAVPAGLYDVRLSAPGFVPVVLPAVQVRQDAQTVIDARQLTIVRGVLLGTASRDDDATLGRDSGGLSVALFGNGTTATTVTDASGAFRFDGVLPGSYSVEVSSDGYEPRRENGLAVVGGVDNAAGNFVVTRKRGDVQGVVAIEGQTVFSGVRVALLDSPLVTFTDATGRYSFRAPVGNYSGVRASLPFFRAETVQKTVTVTDQGTFTVDAMTLRGESGLIAGRILLADPFPDGHGGTTVTLTGVAATATDGIVARTTTDATGAFAFDEAGAFVVDSAGVHPLAGTVFAFAGVPVGRYRITAVPRVDANASATGQRQTLTEPNLIVVAGEVTPWNVTSNTLFVLVNQGAVLANNRLVRLDLGATNCFRMKLRVDAEPDGTTTAQPCSTPVLNFDLGTTQGERRVFAEFTDGEGILIGKANDSITLDSLTQIVSFTHGVTQKLDFGARVTFTARTGEPRGRAVVAIEGYDTGIVLAEGGGGCTAGEVGCYGLQYQLLKRIDIKPNSPTQLSGPGTTTVSFTDEAGNVASARAATALEVAIPPVIGGVVVSPDLFAQNATVRFTTDEPATGVVRPGQLESSLCTTGCPTTTLGTTHQVTITGAQAGEPGGVFLRNKAYFVRVEATDSKGNLAGSAVLQFFLQPDPPRMVVPIPMDQRVLVRWEAPPQEDLAGYFVERSEDGGPFVRISGATPYNHEVLTYNDTDVVNGQQYSYRVRAVDFFGNASEPGTTTDMAKNADGTFDATKLAAFSACGTVTPAAATSTAGTDIAGGVLPLCTVWTKAGSPVRVNASIAVPAGGILVVGPSVAVQNANNPIVIVQGRIAVVGDRGGHFDVRENFFNDESPVGAVTFSGSWQGLSITNGAAGAAKVSLRGYRQGDLLYRVRLANCSTCLTTPNPTTVLRSSVGGRLSWSGGAKGLLAGSIVTDPAGRFNSSDQIEVSDGNSFFGQRSGGSFHGSNLCPSTITSCSAGGLSAERTSDSTVRSRSWSTSSGTYNTTVVMLGSDDSALGGELTLSGIVRSSVVTSAGPVRWLGTELGATNVLAPLLVASTDASRWQNVNLLSAGCALSGQVEASFGFGSTLALASTFLECATTQGSNVERVVDFNDDITKGTITIDTARRNAFPQPFVDGPQLINLPAARAGFTLRVTGMDREDGPLPDAQCFWTDGFGARIGAGPVLSVQGLTATTTFTARVVDSAGSESTLPWTIEVRNDSTLADSWMWPDRDRWRAAALQFEQVPPTVDAPDAATFRWRCAEAGCTTTCAFDPDPNADITTVANSPCRSPVELAGLLPGTSHTFVVQARDGNGAAIDRPHRYTWTVAGSDHVAMAHPAPIVRVAPSADSATAVTMLALDSPVRRVTCSVDDGPEQPCGPGLTVAATAGTGAPRRTLVMRTRSRAGGQEVAPPRFLRLDDADDGDGDGWLDGDDPCLAGAERGTRCADPDGDGHSGAADACPVGELPDSTVVEISAGRDHTCAVGARGHVLCTGRNDAAQLGDGTTTRRSVPVAVQGLGTSAASHAIQVAGGVSHTCALLRSGAVRCWGENVNGKLGNGSTANPGTPVAAVGITTARKLVAGESHSCVLLADATVQCWGRGGEGALGTGSTGDRTTPTTVVGLSGVVDLAAGTLHTCAVLTDGGVRCWGENVNGRLGDGSTTDTGNRLSPVAVSGLTDAVGVVAGFNHTCAVRANGALACWGNNSFGQLGTGDTNQSTVAGPGVFAPVPSLATGVRAIAAGSAFSCAITAIGVSCWGRGERFQLGVGDTSNSSIPLQVPGTAGVTDVVTAHAHACVMRNDGAVACWGDGSNGQLGNGSTSDVSRAPTTGTPGWNPVFYPRGPLENDVDSDGCEDP